MSRIMLVCPEPLAHGQPAGVGIRFLEIARVLRADGHHVEVLAPDVQGLTPETFLEISRRSDAAVVQGHVANAFFEHAAPIPTVIDLYDPFLIENFHYFAERGAEVFRHDHYTLLNSVARGDFFLCASEAQRMFYLGLMLATGRLNPELFESDPRLESLIAVAPFGVPPPRSTVHRANRDILFGGIYDWYDPILAIEAVRLVPGATLTFTHHPNPGITPQGKLADAMQHARRNHYDFVRFEPWAPYENRAEFFERFSLALITFPRSLETDLSMRTRIYDYLWCGLPIVTSSAPGTDEILERYDAGTVVRDERPEAYADAIVSRLVVRSEVEGSPVSADASTARKGFEQFSLEHQWERTLAPLRAFCNAPRFDLTKETYAPRQMVIPDRPVSILDRLKRRLR